MISKEIEKEIAILFREWDASEISELNDTINETVQKDLMVASDYPNYNSSDIRIAIKRVIIETLKLNML